MKQCEKMSIISKDSLGLDHRIPTKLNHNIL